jgi:hypothetical protein
LCWSANARSDCDGRRRARGPACRWRPLRRSAEPSPGFQPCWPKNRRSIRPVDASKRIGTMF